MSTHDEPDGSTTTAVKAFGGDRATHLEALADKLDEFAALMPTEKLQRDAHGYGEQLRIIADEIGPHYRTHSQRTALECGCGFPVPLVTFGLGKLTKDYEEVTCRGCLRRHYFEQLDAEFVRRTGTNWYNLCGDPEPIDEWFESNMNVEDVVSGYIEKFDLTEIT